MTKEQLDSIKNLLRQLPPGQWARIAGDGGHYTISHGFRAVADVLMPTELGDSPFAIGERAKLYAMFFSSAQEIIAGLLTHIDELTEGKIPEETTEPIPLPKRKK